MREYKLLPIVLLLFVAWHPGELRAELPVQRTAYQHVDNAVYVYPIFKAQHTSALFRGEPFAPEKDEETVDSLTAGVRIVYRRVEIDVTQGYKCLNCNLGHGKPEEATEVTFTVRIGRGWRFGR